MKAIVITGYLGLVGSYCAKHLAENGYKVFGIDNDLRSSFFKDLKSLEKNDIKNMNTELGIKESFYVDIRNYEEIEKVFNRIAERYEIEAIVHCAAQPSHDWAASSPFVDFEVNSMGTLNLLEATRRTAQGAKFVFLSTNKVYGDNPNKLKLLEKEFRYDVEEDSKYYQGIDETMSIDNCKHSLFGCSKASADLYVQEYSRYFKMKTISLRGGCLTGGRHRGTKLHGFLNYLVKSAMMNIEYSVIGYGGKQVRDNLHGSDIALLVDTIIQSEWCDIDYNNSVYNLGGGRDNSISIMETINSLKNDFGLNLKYTFEDKPRIGDHQWYISDISKLERRFKWKPKTNLTNILEEIINQYK